MKTINNTAIFFITLLFLFADFIIANAQTGEKVDVISEYEPVISDAFKINVNPVIADTIFPKQEVKYSVLNKQAPTAFNISEIKPVKIKDVSIKKLYRFLLKGGFGNYTTPLAELTYNTLYSKSYTIAANIKHFSSSGNIKDYAYPGFSDCSASVSGNKFYSNHKFHGGVEYKRNSFHYYGFQPDDYVIQPDKDDISQRFNHISAEAGVNSLFNPDSLMLNHNLNVKYQNFFNLDGKSENNVIVDADVNKELKILKITKSQVLGIKGKLDYYYLNDSIFNFNNNIISLTPYLRTKFKAFTFNIGLDAAFASDSNTTAYLFPLADVQLNIVRDILIIYGGLKGGLRHNGFRSLAQENQFVSDNVEYRNTCENMSIFAGIRSNISKELNAQASASYTATSNLPLFISDTSALYDNKFTVVYDSAYILKLRGEIGWQKDEKFSLRLGGDFWNYELLNQQKAWHKPLFDIFVDFRYNLASKIIFNACMYSYSESWNISPKDGTPVKIKPYSDINISLEYRYSKILSAFINLNNISSVKYQQWYNYPNYGLNVLGGFTYSF